MAGIMLGNRTLLSYSTDINNYYPTAVYQNIDNLGAFPEVKISSSNQTIETYDQEYLAVLRGDLKISNISIVVHYDPSNVGHQFLNSAYSTNKVFQLKFSIYESPTSLRQNFIILNGKITAWKDDADINKVYGRTWTFSPASLVNQGSIDEPAPLLIGNYGIGANGTVVPHYEADPTGNAFIKVGATRTDNPLGVDLLGVGMVDAGGTNKAQIVVSESATPRMYIRNTDSTGWDQVYSTANKPSLAAGATQGVTGTLPISSGGTGATVASTALSNLGGMPKTGGAFTGGVTGTTLSLSSTLAVTGASTLTGAVTVNNTINQDGVSSALYGHTSLSSSAAGSKSYLRKMRGGTGDTVFHETVQAGNYRISTGATTDSSDALTLSSTGNLTITGGLNASSATLSTALPISSGGTGASTQTAALQNLNGVAQTTTVNGKPLSSSVVLTQTDVAGTAKNGANSDITSLSGLTTALSLAQGGTGSNTQAGARTSLGLGTASTYNIGTSGATVPVLNASNTWSGTQNLDGLSVGAAKAGSVGIELGSLTTAGSAFIDFHSAGYNNDYDARIISSGGSTDGTSNQGTLTLSGSKLQFNGTPSFNTAIPIASGGTSATTAIAALQNLNGVAQTTTVNGKSLSSNVNLSALDVNALPYYGMIPTGTNLNTLNGSVYGVYEQPVIANATTALSYPVAVGGTLFVLKSGVTHANSCTQVYYPSSTDDIYNRTGTSNSSGVVTWSSWVSTANITSAGVNSSIKSLTGLTVPLVPQTRKINGYSLSSDLTLNASDVGAVPTTRKLNGYALSSDITLNADDVGALPSRGIIPAGTDLNDLDGTVQGYYQQTLNANATALLNYPVQYAGTLVVLQNSATHIKSCTQMYYRYNTNDLYTRTGYSNSSGVISWGAWGMYAYTDINGANSTIKSLTGLTTPLVPQTRKVNNKALSADITLTASDVAAVPTSRTINGKPLSGNVVLTQADIEGTVPSTLMINGFPLTGDINLSQADFSGTIPVSQGGTGATTAAAGLAALGGFALAGGTVTGASTFNSSLTANSTLTVKNTLNQDSVPQSTYCHTSMSTGTAGGKSYLRKFKGGSGSTDATFHETVQGTTYRIATGTTDTTDLLKLSNTGELTTRVIEADEVLAATPPNNFSGAGGLVRSTISAAGAELSAAYMFSVYEKSSSGVETRKARIVASGGSPSIQSYFDIGQDGSLLATNGTFRSLLSIGSPVPAPWWESAQSGKSGIYQNMTTDPVGVSAIGALSWAYRHNGGYELRSMWGNVGNGMTNWANTSLTQFGDSGNAGTRYWYFIPATGDLTCTAGGGWSGSYTFQKAATSDATLKHDIEYNDGKASYENIKKLKPCTFIYNFDPMERERRGIIAQDALRDIDSEYVKLVPAAPEYDDEGNRCDKDDTLALDNNVIMMDTALALNHSIAKIEAMENEIAELRAMIAAINK
ncbi:tail fiber domain-containing protein [Leclercia sp.]|uniref:tail fiber domain-containing protein n=1 Tax=Leclercia sp. TaxID=1898428 RepID=UPI002FDCC48A